MPPMPSVRAWCTFMTSAARPPVSPSTRVNSHSGRARSNAVIAALRGERDDGVGGVRRRCVDAPDVPGEVEVVIDRPAGRAHPSRRFDNPLTKDRDEPGRPFELRDERVPLGAVLEPGDADDGGPQRGIVLHVPRERIAVSHERAHCISLLTLPSLRFPLRRRLRRRSSPRATDGCRAGSRRRAPARGRRATARMRGRRSPSARSTCCSTRSTPAPVSSATSRSTGRSRSTMIGARPRLSSSTISNFGGTASARPIASICCSPPDNRPAGRSSRRSRAGKYRSARDRSEPCALPSRRFSATVSWKNSDRSSGTCARPDRAILWTGRCATLRPSTRTSPAMMGSSPDTVSSVVVLPAPFGPSSTTTSPPCTASERSRTTANAVVAGREPFDGRGERHVMAVRRRGSCRGTPRSRAGRGRRRPACPPRSGVRTRSTYR